MEHISVENMDLCVKILLGIVEEYAQCRPAGGQTQSGS
jgi:hypothetical protein